MPGRRRSARRRSLSLAGVLGMVLLLPAITSNTIAEQAAPAPKVSPPAAKSNVPTTKPGPKAAPPVTMAPQVSIEQVLYLIRSTLLTLNDANRSGNYTVLRDLAAPNFQAKNTAADLSLAFADLRRRRFDLFGVALLPPQLTATPTIDADGRLRLSGLFPTRPLQIKFDLMYEVSADEWKLVGISIATPEAPPLEAQAQDAQPAPKASSTTAKPATHPVRPSTPAK